MFEQMNENYMPRMPKIKLQSEAWG